MRSSMTLITYWCTPNSNSNSFQKQTNKTLTNVAPLNDEDDAVENAVVVNICAPPRASRKFLNVSLYAACKRRQFFKR